MDVFFKAAAMALLAAILTLFLANQEKDIGTVLSILACCMVGAAAVHYLEPVFSFLTNLLSMSLLQNEIFESLLKVVGITLLSEFAGTICADAGNGSLSKMLHLLGTGVILYLSIPVFEALTDILTEIIGEL